MRSVAGDLLSRMLLKIVMYVSNQLGFIMCCELNASYIARMRGKMNLITFFAAESPHEGLTSLPPVPTMWSCSLEGGKPGRSKRDCLRFMNIDSIYVGKALELFYIMITVPAKFIPFTR
jgi:hypothetical protein